MVLKVRHYIGLALAVATQSAWALRGQAPPEVPFPLKHGAPVMLHVAGQDVPVRVMKYNPDYVDVRFEIIDGQNGVEVKDIPRGHVKTLSEKKYQEEWKLWKKKPSKMRDQLVTTTRELVLHARMKQIATIEKSLDYQVGSLATVYVTNHSYPVQITNLYTEPGTDQPYADVKCLFLKGNPEVTHIPRRRLKVIHEDTFDAANAKLQKDTKAAEKALTNIQQMVHFTVDEEAIQAAKDADTEEVRYQQSRDKTARSQLESAGQADRMARQAARAAKEIDMKLEKMKKVRYTKKTLPIHEIADMVKRRDAATMAKEAWEQRAMKGRKFPEHVVQEKEQEKIDKVRKEKEDAEARERATAEARAKAEEAARVLEEEREKVRAEKRAELEEAEKERKTKKAFRQKRLDDLHERLADAMKKRKSRMEAAKQSRMDAFLARERRVRAPVGAVGAVN